MVKKILRDDDLLTNATINEKARLLDACMRTYGISYDKERLEFGKSTSNVGLAGLVTHVHEHALFSEEELTGGRSGSSDNAQQTSSEKDSPGHEEDRAGTKESH